MIKWVLVLVSMLVSSFALGAIVENSGLPEATAALPVTPEFLDFLVASFNGIKGASIFGAAALMVQLLIKVMDQPFSNHFFGNRSGLNKILIVSALTFAVTPLGLVSGAGLSIGAALVHSSTLASLMVFLNQLYRQAMEAKAAKAKKDLAKKIEPQPN
jgi:hypothetical protein